MVTASSFVGDGSELTGAGFATALNDTTSILNNVFKTPRELPVGTGVSVTTSLMQHREILHQEMGAIHVGAGLLSM